MKHRKALLSGEELLGTKSAKRVRELVKHVSKLCTGKSRTKHIIMVSINTYHLACAKGSVLQCCSFRLVLFITLLFHMLLLLLFGLALFFFVSFCFVLFLFCFWHISKKILSWLEY